MIESRKDLLKDVVLRIIYGKEKTFFMPNQFENLVSGVGEILNREKSGACVSAPPAYFVSEKDRSLINEIFDELDKAGIIGLGSDEDNKDYPFFHVNVSMLTPNSDEADNRFTVR